MLCVALVSSLVTYSWAASSTSTFTISGGQYPGAPSYTIYSVGSTYYAKDQFGAVSWSSTDASDIIETAGNTGSSLKIMAGTYQCLTPIIFTHSVDIVGENKITTILNANFESGNLITFKGSSWLSGIGLHNLCLNSTADTQYGLDVVYAVNNKDCGFDNLLINGFQVGMHIEGCWGLKFSNIVIDGTSCNVGGVLVEQGQAQYYSDSITFDNVRVEFFGQASTYGYGFKQYGGSAPIFTGCVCQGLNITGKYGLVLQGVNGGVWQGGYMETMGTAFRLDNSSYRATSGFYAFGTYVYDVYYVVDLQDADNNKFDQFTNYGNIHGPQTYISAYAWGNMFGDGFSYTSTYGAGSAIWLSRTANGDLSIYSPNGVTIRNSTSSHVYP